MLSIRTASVEGSNWEGRVRIRVREEEGGRGGRGGRREEGGGLREQ